MTSIPPPPGDRGWDPYQGRPFVAVERRPRGVFDMTVSSGAVLRDFVDVTASLPRIVFVDHWSVLPGGTDVTLRFRSVDHGAGAGGGWVPTGDASGSAGWTPYQDALHTLFVAAPDGPTGERLGRDLLRIDPRSAVALADMLRLCGPVRV